MSRLKYKNTCTAQGRNGTSKAVALDIVPSTRINENNEVFEVIILTPENSQGDLTNCWIDIDIKIVPELIKQLQYFYDNSSETSGIPRQSKHKSK